jgi:lysozyme
MTYNPSDAFSKAAYTQYGASRSAAPKKSVTAKDTSGSDFGQFTRRVTNTTTSKPSTTKTTGLMSSSRDRRKEREKKTGFTVSDVKDIVTRLFSSSGGDSSPKPKPKPDPSKLYSSAAMVIPAVSAISVSELPPAAKAEASPYRSPYMRPQPINRDRSPSIYKFAGGRDPYMERRGSPGLMAPPAPEPFNRPRIDDLINRTVARTMLDDNTTYKIKSGDTLSAIAKMVGTSVDELVKRNTNITDPDKIRAGDTINIPVTSETIRSLQGTEDPRVRISFRNKPFFSLDEEEVEEAIIDRLVEEEGFVGEAYKPVADEKYYTIGYGHYGKDVKVGDTITETEARELLREDVQKRLPQIKKAMPNFNKLSPALQVEIAQSWFRGGIAGSPKTIKLINKGKWTEAAKEFLDNDEYRDPTTLPGVKRRMEGLSIALQEEALQ